MTEISFIETELQKFNVTDAAIETMKKEFMPLRIEGIEDTESYRKVHKARMFVKGKRVEVDKKRKELKADALEYGRRVENEAKRIMTQLRTIEDHLDTQQKAIDEEKERIKIRKQREAALPERQNKLAGLGIFMDDEKILQMDDLQFNQFYNTEKQKLEEARLKAKEEELRRKEEEAIKKEREAEERERKIKEESERIEREKEAIKRQYETKEAIEAAVKDSQDKALEIEARSNEQEKIIEELERQVAESSKPKKIKRDGANDKEKIIACAEALAEYDIAGLRVESEDAKYIVREAQVKLDLLVFFMKSKAKTIE